LGSALNCHPISQHDRLEIRIRSWHADPVMTRNQPLDEIDLKILDLLRVDGRRSARSLSKEIGMSAGAISERISRLERSGAIRGYHADIDPSALGYEMQVLVGLQVAQGREIQHAIDALLAAPEVIALYVVSGRWDLVVLVQVRDHAHLRDVVLEGVWNTPGFRHSETMLILIAHHKVPGV